ncbi:hypothetical protein DAEQUDRAFT_62125 [Daedalea quercina L-15889]|uniref:F-box domain-containing protein n=1 Tax=Daedalea quercina L-15889 TaxID=1314783 RepID=A0A165SM39_9APHY|nr:hypothetical protein DAEQUDRAFT_62125 [Daedalea quercina L-15889]
MRSRLPRLPQEIIDLIIYSLVRGEDRLTLRSCSLTCRAWLSTSRAQLFRFVVFHNHSAVLRLSAILEQSPYIGDFIRRLELHFDKFKSPNDLHILQSVFVWTRSLHSLVLTDVFPTANNFVLPEMASVSELILWRMSFRAANDFRVLMASLPNIRALRIFSLRMPALLPLESDEYPKQVSDYVANMHQLELDRCPAAIHPF